MLFALAIVPSLICNLQTHTLQGLFVFCIMFGYSSHDFYVLFLVFHQLYLPNFLFLYLSSLSLEGRMLYHQIDRCGTDIWVTYRQGWINPLRELGAKLSPNTPTIQYSTSISTQENYLHVATYLRHSGQMHTLLFIKNDHKELFLHFCLCTH